MKDEVKRISQLVAEGKLSPEDAADLIEAFYASERAEEQEATASGETPPPPPGAPDAHKDPFKSLIEGIEKLTKEGVDSVNWQEVSRQARDSAKKGLDAFKSGIEDLSKGKVNIGWMSSHESRVIDLPLSVPEGKTLRIENACGDVKVIGGSDLGSVRAEAQFRGGSSDDAKAKAESYTLIIEESDHLVLVRQPDVSGLSVDINVHLSNSAMVELRCESGDVTITNTKAGARISCRSGDIKLDGLNGLIDISSDSGDVTVTNSETPSLTIENKSGDIHLESVAGNINSRTASGDVTLRRCQGKVIAVESISGDVHVDLDEPVVGNLNVRTVNGNAHIDLPDGSDCRVSLSTLRGQVVCSLELQDEARAEQRITGRLGEGAGTLDVSAVTGNIALGLRESVTA